MTGKDMRYTTYIVTLSVEFIKFRSKYNKGFNDIQKINNEKKIQ